MERKAGKGKMQTLRTGSYSKAGFTLLELIIVIFILSLVMAVVFPSFYGIVDGRLKSESGKIASLLRYLNDSAISRKETFILKINLDSNTFLWEGPDGKRSESFNGLLDIFTTSTGSVSRGEVILSFGPLGIQENLRIHLRDKDKEMAVTLNPMSGRVKIIQSSK